MTLARLLLSTCAEAVFALALALAWASRAEAAASEAQVKAAYLYKLASFVRWPTTAFADPATPLRICVAGRGDVHAAIEALARGQEASGRTLATALVDPAHGETAADCQILFVGQNDTTSRALLGQAGPRPVLTVTDRSLGVRGGIIEFVRVGGSIRFVIHRRAAEVRQLLLSSKLLAVATSVEP